MTVFSSGISMYAMAKLLQILHIFDAPFAALGLGPEYIFHVCIVSSALVVLVYVLLGGLSSAIYNEVLQFFLIVAGFLPLVYLGLRDAGGWAGIVRDAAADADARVARVRQRRPPTRWASSVRPGDGPRLRAVVRLLVHRLPRRPARDGGRLDDRGAAHAADRRASRRCCFRSW